MGPKERKGTQSGPLRSSQTRVGVRQVNVITTGRHITLQPQMQEGHAAEQLCFLGRGRLLEEA